MMYCNVSCNHWVIEDYLWSGKSLTTSSSNWPLCSPVVIEVRALPYGTINGALRYTLIRHYLQDVCSSGKSLLRIIRQTARSYLSSVLRFLPDPTFLVQSSSSSLRLIHSATVDFEMPSHLDIWQLDMH
jgi:hypothetical protein